MITLTTTDETIEHIRQMAGEIERLRSALEEIKRLITASNRSYSSERMDRVEWICDEVLAETSASPTCE